MVNHHFIKAIILIGFSTGLMALETPKYRFISKGNGYEIRQYQSMIIASTKVDMDYSQATSTGFRRIANYIFGGNSTGLSIEMTAPVMSDVPNSKNICEVMFFMPSEHSINDLPKPNTIDVRIKEFDLGKAAVLRFGGWATKERVKHYKEKLKKRILAEGHNVAGAFLVAQYNSPWVIPPFRKNEIIVQIN